jgi:type IV pilus assembly protein PilW
MPRTLPARGAQQRGFSLVELMVAIVVGMILTAGILFMFVTNKRAYNETERFARMQENGRFALETLTHDLRHVFFWGDARYFDLVKDSNLGTVTNDCSGDASAYEFDTSLWATSATASSALTCITDALVVAGIPSDILAVKYAQPNPVEDDNNDSVIDTVDGLVANRPYVMTNHLLGEVFVASGSPLSGVPSIAVGGEIPEGRAWEYSNYVYYVRAGTDSTPPALARKSLRWNGTAMAMVTEDVAEGIEGLRILYGFDTNNDGDPDTFSPASGVSTWDGVVSARIFVLVRSMAPEWQFEDTKSYQLGDVTVTATQGEAASQGGEMRNFHRMVLSTTVNVRNPNLVLTGGF